MVHVRYMRWGTAFITLCVLGVGVWLWQQPSTVPVDETPVQHISTAPQVLNRTSYVCDNEHHVDVAYLERHDLALTSSTPDAPPVPTGAVTVVFDSAPPISLNQTLSADGARYATDDESLVVWNKGQGIMVLDHDKETTYTGCIALSSDPGALPQTYGSSTLGFSVRYPAEYTVVTSHADKKSATTTIPGVFVRIGTSTATGTNLASDSGVAIASLPLGSAACTADTFIDVIHGGATSTITAGDVEYSFASTSDAGAGNRYEEQVFVRSGTEACVAVRYFIHHSAMENYNKGAVHEFDERLLLSTFDSIRDAVVIQ
jgi:membrane-bound inhibitor of C-type lysozyme